MNKKIIFTFTSVLLIIVLLIFLSLRHYNILVPNAGELVSASVSFDQSNFRNLSDEEAENILTFLSTIKSTVHNSVNDTPYADSYYIINMESNSSHYTFYIYELGSRYFVEQPYNGKYRIKKDLYNSIVSIID